MASTYNIVVPNDGEWHEVGDAATTRIIENREPVAAVEFALGAPGALPASDLLGHALRATNYALPGVDSRESFKPGVALFLRHQWRHPITIIVSEI